MGESPSPLLIVILCIAAIVSMLLFVPVIQKDESDSDSDSDSGGEGTEAGGTTGTTGTKADGTTTLTQVTGGGRRRRRGRGRGRLRRRRSIWSLFRRRWRRNYDGPVFGLRWGRSKWGRRSEISLLNSGRAFHIEFPDGSVVCVNEDRDMMLEAARDPLPDTMQPVRVTWSPLRRREARFIEDVRPYFREDMGRLVGVRGRNMLSAMGFGPLDTVVGVTSLRATNPWRFDRLRRDRDFGESFGEPVVIRFRQRTRGRVQWLFMNRTSSGRIVFSEDKPAEPLFLVPV